MSSWHPIRRVLQTIRHDWRAASERHPAIVAAIAGTFAVVAAASLASSVWFLTTIVRGLPDESAIGRIGEMNQATTVYDASDKLAFAIFTEQRIEVPLAEISPNLIHAIVAVEDQRF